MSAKRRAIKSNAIRRSAAGERCTIQISGVCNHDPATTVLAHLPDESNGMGRKSDDISACYACQRCHDVIDGRYCPSVSGAHPDEWINNRDFYMRRALVRTWRRLIDKGIISIVDNDFISMPEL